MDFAKSTSSNLYNKTHEQIFDLHRHRRPPPFFHVFEGKGQPGGIEALIE
jgi:hypothetical protein